MTTGAVGLDAERGSALGGKTQERERADPPAGVRAPDRSVTPFGSARTDSHVPGLRLQGGSTRSPVVTPRVPAQAEAVTGTGFEVVGLRPQDRRTAENDCGRGSRAEDGRSRPPEAGPAADHLRRSLTLGDELLRRIPRRKGPRGGTSAALARRVDRQLAGRVVRSGTLPAAGGRRLEGPAVDIPAEISDVRAAVASGLGTPDRVRPGPRLAAFRCVQNPQLRTSFLRRVPPPPWGLPRGYMEDCEGWCRPRPASRRAPEWGVACDLGFLASASVGKQVRCVLATESEVAAHLRNAATLKDAGCDDGRPQGVPAVGETFERFIERETSLSASDGFDHEIGRLALVNAPTPLDDVLSILLE